VTHYEQKCILYQYQGLCHLIFTPKLLVYDAILYSVCKVGNDKEYNDVKTILDS